MTTEARNPLSTAVRSEESRRPVRSYRSLRWLNGAVHWISAVVLTYAFISNGEKTRALINSAAMRGEVELGLIVGAMFLIRFIWVQSTRSGGGRWAGSSVRMPQSIVRRVTDLGIYLGVAASVVTGILIAYLRPSAEIIPERRGFSTSSPALNAVIEAHAFVSDALIWLCIFHAAYSLCHWLMKRTQWGRTAEAWVEQAVSAAGRVAGARLRRENFRL